MERLTPGIWKDSVEGVEIIVDEKLNIISTILPGGKLVKVNYQETPTVHDFACFRSGVEEALWVLKRLKIQ